MNATASELCLLHIVAEYADGDEFRNPFKIAEVGLIIPVRDAWLTGYANIVKRIKSRMRIFYIVF